MSDISYTNPPLFITARFRTGSTMLWNLFRQLPETRVYYEPLHEQLLSYIKHPIEADRSHFFVKSYFDEYRDVPNISSLHRTDFANDRLYLEGENTHTELHDYIQALVESVSLGQTAVLQFNRIDFRLAWIKKNFPEARLLHLSRNPRDQWYSTLAGFSGDIDHFIDFDQYSLATWARDLYKQFPFLATPQIEHAYQRFYYLWKLGYLAGQRSADMSVAYEDILAEPRKLLVKILKFSNLYSENNLETCLRFIVSRPERAWNKDRSDAWFLDMEQKCEQVLDELGLNKNFALMPLGEIQKQSPKYQALLRDPENDRWATMSFKRAVAQERSAVYETYQQYEDATIQRNEIQAERDQLQLARNQLQLDKDSLQHELDLVYHSRSWRITAPIRNFTDMGRRLLSKTQRLLPLRSLPRRAMLKAIHKISLWIIVHPNVNRRMIAMINHFPAMKNRLKRLVYGPSRSETYLPVEEHRASMTPRVRTIYLDLVNSIKNKK